MTATPQSFGPALVKVGTGQSGQLEELGYTRQGVEERNQAFFIDIPGDQHGGDQGPPIEVQYLGEIAQIRCELTKYDEAIAAKVRSRTLGGTEGQPGTPGTMMFSDSKTVRVLISPSTSPRNFPRCFVRNAWEINRGTRYATFVVEFEAHKDANGVLVNAVTT